ncbi:MAG: outer membrane protein assembly factor BamD [Verrucomicrobiota bacterium]|nr:outer membrane protein assembly factor BamD [Verrucomicrobiota bacterium]
MPNPGEEVMSGSAKQLFDVAQAAENSGDTKRAIKAYRALVRKHPKDALAPGAAFQYALLQEKTGDFLRAAAAYRVLVENYPRSPHFNDAIEAQFRIGEMYLNGKKIRLLGIPVRGSIDRAIEIFAAIVRSAPYGPYTARAQFYIGRATEKQGNADAAVAAYQGVIEKYPNDPLAADAQYQIGYIWFTEARHGTKDAKAVERSRIAFQDFLFRYPKSEKVAQARENLRLLAQKQTSDAFSIAKYYDKQKNYRAAVIYYNDVIRQQPGSSAGDRAKKRVAELRAKVGDAALQPAALTAATAKAPGKKPDVPATHAGLGPASGAPPMHTSPGDVAPLPPPEADESLPPPASLQPDTTTAPALPPDTATPEPSPSPGGSPE